jgi:hypothetical protein
MIMMMMVVVVVVVVVMVVAAAAAAVNCPLYGSQNLSTLHQTTVVQKLTSSSSSILILT